MGGPGAPGGPIRIDSSSPSLQGLQTMGLRDPGRGVRRAGLDYQGAGEGAAMGPTEA